MHWLAFACTGLFLLALADGFFRPDLLDFPDFLDVGEQAEHLLAVFRLCCDISSAGPYSVALFAWLFRLDLERDFLELVFLGVFLFDLSGVF